MPSLLTGLPAPGPDEVVERLAGGGATRIERIVSDGHSSPAGFWYDQDEDEWVLLVQGGATLELAAPEERVELGPGDYLFIPAHRRHRVERTQPRTVWLAVFWAAARAPRDG